MFSLIYIWRSNCNRIMFHVKHEQIDTAMRLLRDQLHGWGWALEPENSVFYVGMPNYSPITEANVIGTKEAQGIILDHVLDSPLPGSGMSDCKEGL